MEAGGCEYNPRTVRPEEINIYIPYTIGTFIECYPLFEPKFIPKINQKTARSNAAQCTRYCDKMTNGQLMAGILYQRFY